ncbi:MAG TPA: hypothetical protein VG388_08725 [Solirubrobacteraceae bacterium]|nr:hypothetical protein [Solirubrobacteraceae bacterium]
MAGGQLILILLWFGLAGGVVGKRKGGSFWLWFLVSFCVPVIGLLTAIVARPENRELRRQCPGCGKVVKLHDALCTRCGTELEFPEVAIFSEAAVRKRKAQSVR